MGGGMLGVEWVRSLLVVLCQQEVAWMGGWLGNPGLYIESTVVQSFDEGRSGTVMIKMKRYFRIFIKMKKKDFQH